MINAEFYKHASKVIKEINDYFDKVFNGCPFKEIIYVGFCMCILNELDTLKITSYKVINKLKNDLEENKKNVIS